MEMERGQAVEALPEADVSGTCRMGWYRFVADVLRCFTVVGVALRRVFTWRNNTPEIEDDDVDSISILSGATTDSSFTIRALEDSYLAFHDFGETEIMSNISRKPNAARGVGARRKDSIKDCACYFDGKYATVSAHVKPTKIDVRGHGEPNAAGKIVPLSRNRLPRSTALFTPKYQSGKAVEVKHKTPVEGTKIFMLSSEKQKKLLEQNDKTTLESHTRVQKFPKEVRLARLGENWKQLVLSKLTSFENRWTNVILGEQERRKDTRKNPELSDAVLKLMLKETEKIVESNPKIVIHYTCKSDDVQKTKSFGKHPDKSNMAEKRGIGTGIEVVMNLTISGEGEDAKNECTTSKLVLDQMSGRAQLLNFLHDIQAEFNNSKFTFLNDEAISVQGDRRSQETKTDILKTARRPVDSTVCAQGVQKIIDRDALTDSPKSTPIPGAQNELLTEDRENSERELSSKSEIKNNSIFRLQDQTKLKPDEKCKLDSVSIEEPFSKPAEEKSNNQKFQASKPDVVPGNVSDESENKIKDFMSPKVLEASSLLKSAAKPSFSSDQRPVSNDVQEKLDYEKVTITLKNPSSPEDKPSLSTNNFKPPNSKDVQEKTISNTSETKNKDFKTDKANDPLTKPRADVKSMKYSNQRHHPKRQQDVRNESQTKEFTNGSQPVKELSSEPEADAEPSSPCNTKPDLKLEQEKENIESKEEIMDSTKARNQAELEAKPSSNQRHITKQTPDHELQSTHKDSRKAKEDVPVPQAKTESKISTAKGDSQTPKEDNPLPQAKAETKPSTSNNQQPSPKEKQEISNESKTIQPTEAPETVKNPTSQAEGRLNTSSNQPSKTKEKVDNDPQTRNSKENDPKPQPKTEAKPNTSSNQPPNPKEKQTKTEDKAQSHIQEMKFKMDPSMMPKIGDDIRTMQIKMLQQLAFIEQHEQLKAQEQGLPAGPMYPFSPQWLLANQDELCVIEASDEFPSQEEGSSGDDMSPCISRVESESEAYEDDFTDEDEEDEDDDDNDEEKEEKDEEEEYYDEGDDEDEVDEEYNSNPSAPEAIYDEEEISEIESIPADSSMEIDEDTIKTEPDIETQLQSDTQKDASQFIDTQKYESSVKEQPFDYEEDVLGECQTERSPEIEQGISELVEERNPTPQKVPPPEEVSSDRVDISHRRILKGKKHFPKGVIDDRLKEMEKCWKRVGKNAKFANSPNRRQMSPEPLAQKTLRMEEDKRMQKGFECYEPIILRVATDQKVYHLKLKVCTFAGVEFDALVPYQENLRTYVAATSKIPIRTPKSNTGKKNFHNYGFGPLSKQDMRKLSRRCLVVRIKIHGKRLEIPLDTDRGRNLVMDFIKNPHSTAVTDPNGVGKYILDKALKMLEEQASRRRSRDFGEDLRTNIDWDQQSNTSKEAHASDGDRFDDLSPTPNASEGGDVEGEAVSASASKIRRRLPLPGEEIQEPQPFTDDLFAERTEQLLAEKAEKERRGKAEHYQTDKYEYQSRKTFANKFTFMESKYLDPKPSKRFSCEIKNSIGFVPKNEKCIQVDVEADTSKEQVRKEEVIDAPAYPIQLENFEIGTYRMDECVAVEKAKKGHLESLGAKKKVKTRGIPNKHLGKRQYQEKFVKPDKEDEPIEEESVFGNPEKNVMEPKPIFVEDESAELDTRHIEEKPCKVLQKRRTEPVTPGTNKNRKKRHRTNTGPNSGGTKTNLTETLFDFSHSRPAKGTKR